MKNSKQKLSTSLPIFVMGLHQPPSIWNAQVLLSININIPYKKLLSFKRSKGHST
ncbi:MAG: hypothetical protein ACREVX_04275 [Clostridium sp.]|uniref:hypothetical protein n=1 Tax=Clostridium sp. TaxID=1506 RepID=UPI003D6C76F3